LTPQPLGLLRICVDDVETKVIVTEQLCADFIVGKDLMRRKDEFLIKLVSAIKRCSDEDARRICAVLLEDNEEARETLVVENIPVKKSSHCEFSPVKFQWKAGGKESLGNNFKEALAEARRLERRLERRNPKLLASYNEILNMWLSEGWLEEINVKEARYFLKHFAVIRDQNGSTAMKRCRIVVEGSKLTPLLEVPPCSHTDLVRNILLWRTAERFVAHDISQAYMRVGIDNADSPYLCITFNERVMQFRSLPMGVSPSAQALQRVVDEYLDDWKAAYPQEKVVLNVVPYI
jgi:hypothetical protein